MTTTVPQTRIDPLHAFVTGAFAAHSRQPLPLIDTRFDVAIDGGLAFVSTARVFCNTEAQPIEATITFPVPVHAILFELKARVGERWLTARARAREDARADYESALERGKTTVLHEEVLRGVHMLSVGQIAPGAEIEVRSRFAVALSHVGGTATLRIPLTVGDIYGRSPLHDSDDLVAAGPGARARLTVTCADGTVTLLGGRLENGSAVVPLDAPIDLAVTGWAAKDLRGRAADGRDVTLRIEPAPAGEAALDLALLVDRSGSMGETCDEAFIGMTKHMAVVHGLDAFAQALRQVDRIDLWQFNQALAQVGSTGGTAKPKAASPAHGALRARDLRTLLRHLPGPNGGTELGGALEGVIARSAARDVLLITDGKSHALDVHALARRGRRICVVLVGEDSLEANVGHLAALTGGEIFVASGLDVRTVLEAAIRALRSPRSEAAAATEPVQRVWVRRGGMSITARWSAAPAEDAPAPEARGVAAFAAGIALALLPAEAAARLAEAEGLVSHLTSLVLVDEAAQGEAVIPATRKVPLPVPRTTAPVALDAAPRMLCAAPPAASARFDLDAMLGSPRPRDGLERYAEEARRRDSGPELPSARIAERAMGAAPHAGGPSQAGLRELATRIAWSTAPGQLQAGDLSGLDPAVAQAVRDAAAHADITALARRLGLDAVVLVIGLMARAESWRDRAAKRIARAILRGAAEADITATARLLGLS